MQAPWSVSSCWHHQQWQRVSHVIYTQSMPAKPGKHFMHLEESFDKGVEFTLGFIQRSPDMFLGLRRVCKSLRTKMQLCDKTTRESSRIMAIRSGDSKMTSNTVYKYHVKCCNQCFLSLLMSSKQRLLEIKPRIKSCVNLIHVVQI